jgi:two-component system, NtrC family, sensor histidine kinase HydH
MKKIFLPRYFLASVVLLLVLVSAYAFSESRRLRGELMRQTEAKAAALAEAVETGARNAILGNSLLEEQIGQRLLDNARLIDQLLSSGAADRDALKQISSMNRLEKVELLDAQGQPWEPPSPPKTPAEMRERMLAHRGEENFLPKPPFRMFMWGRHWPLPMQRKETAEELPPRLKEKKFWEGSVFGVAVGARSFPGVIAVHANADYILNFKNEIGVQRQIEELGRQSDIDYVALLDGDHNVVAHTDRAFLGKKETDPFVLKVGSDGRELSRVVEFDGGKRDYEIVKPVRLNGSTLAFLKIGLSLEPVELAWRNSLRSIVILGLAILAVGILGMTVIFYNQHSHMQHVKTLEAEVARRERLSALGDLAATVAHEVRNPLNAVSMGLQRLKGEFRPTADEEEYGHFIELMRGEVARLNSIVEEFLSLARPLELKAEEVRIDELLRELAALARNDAATTKVEIAVAAAPDLPAARVDRNYFKQVLLNLVLNGVQAMPDGGKLTLEARTAGKNLTIAVSDTGAGIPKEVLPRIFEPYFTTKTRGSGLGLAIARRIVEAHGGRLRAESAAGGGSRFEIAIPLAR